MKLQSKNNIEFKLTNRLLKKLIKINFYSGVGIKITRNEEIIFENYYGSANLADHILPSKQTLYKIMSMSKPMTVAAFFIFMENKITFNSFYNQEKIILSINTEIKHIFPEWAKEKLNIRGLNVRPKNDITIKHLLTMTSGIPYVDQKELLELFLKLRIQSLSYEDFATELSKINILHEPGERWSYGLSLDLLGALVDKILKTIDFKLNNKSIKNWVDFFQLNLLDRLEMKNTFFSKSISKDNVGQVARVSRSKLNNEGNYDLVDFDQPSNESMIETLQKTLLKWDDKDTTHKMLHELMKNFQFASNFLGWQKNLDEAQSCPLMGSTLISTLDDYTKFNHFLLSGLDKDGKQLFSNNLRLEMVKNQLDEAQLSQLILSGNAYQNGYGYGIGVKNSNQPYTHYSRGAFGWDGVLGSLSLADPNLKLSIVVMINSITTNNRVSTKIFDTIYDDLFLNKIID